MFEPTRILIFGKTYPELSVHHTETVCTGGLREDGRPVRLYPVPLRYLEGDHQYRLYEWITVPMQKSTSDPRPESYKVRADQIEGHEVIEADGGPWRRRRDVVFRDRSWHFESMAELSAAQAATGRSIGMIKPDMVDDVELVTKPGSEREAFALKSRDLEAQVGADLFHPDYKRLWYPPKEIRLRWRCPQRCETCRRRPHRMKILDWGLLELARRDGWDQALSRMCSIADLKTNDFRLFLGNFRLRMEKFGIIGLWYPKIQAQGDLLDGLEP